MMLNLTNLGLMMAEQNFNSVKDKKRKESFFGMFSKITLGTLTMTKSVSARTKGPITDTVVMCPQKIIEPVVGTIRDFRKLKTVKKVVFPTRHRLGGTKVREPIIKKLFRISTNEKFKIHELAPMNISFQIKPYSNIRMPKLPADMPYNIGAGSLLQTGKPTLKTFIKFQEEMKYAFQTANPVLKNELQANVLSGQKFVFSVVPTSLYEKISVAVLKIRAGYSSQKLALALSAAFILTISLDQFKRYQRRKRVDDELCTCNNEELGLADTLFLGSGILVSMITNKVVALAVRDLVHKWSNIVYKKIGLKKILNYKEEIGQSTVPEEFILDELVINNSISRFPNRPSVEERKLNLFKQILKLRAGRLPEWLKKTPIWGSGVAVEAYNYLEDAYLGKRSGPISDIKKIINPPKENSLQKTVPLLTVILVGALIVLRPNQAYANVIRILEYTGILEKQTVPVQVKNGFVRFFGTLFDPKKSYFWVILAIGLTILIYICLPFIRTLVNSFKINSTNSENPINFLYNILSQYIQTAQVSFSNNMEYFQKQAKDSQFDLKIKSDKVEAELDNLRVINSRTINQAHNQEKAAQAELFVEKIEHAKTRNDLEFLSKDFMTMQHSHRILMQNCALTENTNPLDHVFINANNNVAQKMITEYSLRHKADPYFYTPQIEGSEKSKTKVLPLTNGRNYNAMVRESIGLEKIIEESSEQLAENVSMTTDKISKPNIESFLAEKDELWIPTIG